MGVCADRAEKRVGVLFIDLDNFKTVNDRFGRSGRCLTQRCAQAGIPGILRRFLAWQMQYCAAVLVVLYCPTVGHRGHKTNQMSHEGRLA